MFFDDEPHGVFFLIDNKSFYASCEAVARGLNPLNVPLVVLSEAENTNGGLILAMSVEELLKVNCAKAVDVLSIGQYGFNLVKIPSSWLHMGVGLSFLHDTSPLVNKIGRTIDQFLLLAISRIIDIVYYGYSMIRFTTGDMTGLLGIIRLVMFSNDYQKKEMISYD